MKQLYTENDIIRFIYDEMDEEEFASFFEVLCKDPELWESYEQLKSAQEALILPDYSPSRQTESSIMAAASKAAKEMAAGKSESAEKHFANPYFRNITLTFSLLILLAGGISSLGDFNLNPFQSGTEIESERSKDNRWIHERLKRMEEDRMLPLLENENQFKLVTYSGQKVYKFTAAQP